MKRKVYQVYSDLYLVNVFMVAEWDRGEILNHFDYDVGKCTGAAVPVDGGVVIYISAFDDEWEGVLVHESIHAANIILEQKGVEVSTRNDEALTYLAQWIFVRCFAVCKRLAAKKGPLKTKK